MTELISRENISGYEFAKRHFVFHEPQEEVREWIDKASGMYRVTLTNLPHFEYIEIRGTAGGAESDFAYVWDTIAMESDDKLDEKAKELKYHLLKMVKEVVEVALVVPKIKPTAH
jgi:hypothetical protein